MWKQTYAAEYCLAWPMLNSKTSLDHHSPTTFLDIIALWISLQLYGPISTKFVDRFENMINYTEPFVI